MGKRIVITSWGSHGDVHPYVGLALGLTARGHRPVLAMPAHYRETVEREGVEFAAVRPTLDPTDPEAVRRIMDPKRGAEYIMRERLFPHVRAAYDDLRALARGADLLLGHPVTFAAPVVAETTGVPWVSTVLAPMSFFSLHDLPVFGPAPWMVHLRKLGMPMRRLLMRAVRRVTREWPEPLYALRAELGLPRGGDPVYEGQFSPRMTLAMFSRVLAAPQPDWPPNTRVTGPVFYDGPGGEKRLSPELARFLDEGEPPVVFTLGTSAVGAAGRFYHESVKAARAAGRRALLLVGRDPANRPAGPLPGGVMAVDYAPHSEVFPRAAATVHHGGVGTLMQALRAGRPTLVVPHAHDQADNAFRATSLGAGRTLFPTRYTARRLERELRALLDDPSYARRAGEVGRTVRAEDGVGAACAAIEEVLGGR